MIVDLGINGLLDFLHILRQGNNDLEMFVADTQSAADSLELVGTCRVLSTGHSRCQVVADNHGDISILVDGIEQTSHTRMGKGRVTDDSNGRPLTGIAGTLGHRD